MNRKDLIKYIEDMTGEKVMSVKFDGYCFIAKCMDGKEYVVDKNGWFSEVRE